MGKSNFLEKINIEFDYYKEAYNEACSRQSFALKMMEEFHKLSDLEIKKSYYNIKPLFKIIINDTNIAYSILDFFKDMDILSQRTNHFKDVAFDLDKIKSLVNSGQIKDDTFMFIAVHFYASHFDLIVNFLKSIVKKIQKHKGYEIKTKKGLKKIKVNNSESVFEVIKRFRPSFFYYINKLLDRNLRNAIAHDDYTFDKTHIYYKKSIFDKDTKIFTQKMVSTHRDDIFKNAMFVGRLINFLQLLEYEYRVQTYRAILNEKMTKKEIKDYLEKFHI